MLCRKSSKHLFPWRSDPSSLNSWYTLQEPMFVFYWKSVCIWTGIVWIRSDRLIKSWYWLHWQTWRKYKLSFPLAEAGANFQRLLWYKYWRSKVVWLYIHKSSHWNSSQWTFCWWNLLFVSFCKVHTKAMNLTSKWRAMLTRWQCFQISHW